MLKGGGFTRRPFFRVANQLAGRLETGADHGPGAEAAAQAGPVRADVRVHRARFRSRADEAMIDCGAVARINPQVSMSATLASRSFRDRERPQCEPMRFRAVITIDFEAGDVVEAQDAMTAIEEAFAPMQPLHGAAQLSFTRRRPRSKPRPGAPGPIIPAYADD